MSKFWRSIALWFLFGTSLGNALVELVEDELGPVQPPVRIRIVDGWTGKVIGGQS